MNATTEMRRDVIRILEGSGVDQVKFDKDGAGHQVAVFRYQQHQMRFHFPSTGRMNGHSRLNVLARLKKQLRNVAPTAPVVETTQQRGDRPAPAPQAPVRHNLTREEKIHKKFTGGESPDLIAEAFNITRARVFEVVREVNARRAGIGKPPPLKLCLKPRTAPPLPGPVIRLKDRKKMRPALIERNHAIVAAYEACRNYSAVGRRFDYLTGARVKQIIAEVKALMESKGGSR